MALRLSAWVNGSFRGRLKAVSRKVPGSFCGTMLREKLLEGKIEKKVTSFFSCVACDGSSQGASLDALLER